ncbi:DNA topoisomerase IV subunit A [Myxococcota bacterium]|nr:DNA topoisomerase IV subunit A [Myxococcota bacterium]
MEQQIFDVALSAEAERRYLNYALSVITSRALPDVRDGLKPVQRRILYAMWHELHLGPDAKPKKCAAIVGDVMGKYHPHGDSAIYEALVRMAQPWAMRAPLVYGQGNFGSLDGDEAAAFRYTEARLEKISIELLAELGKKTVPFRPTFDATHFEPVVLPARFPNLLVNGSQGIAVGMATSIPPHNLGEVCDALDAMIEDPEVSLATLLKKVKGPDFPTGGELLSSKAEIKDVYEHGHGSLKLRGEWKIEEAKGAVRVVITSIPYALEKKTLVEKIADVIISKKLPALVDIRDESTDEVRIVLELKKETNPDLVMAYLAKHTPLSVNVTVNLTCLVPSSNPDVPEPEQLGLRAILKHFLDFRFEVVTKRLQHDLDELERRLHILEGFEKVFDALDEIIKIIRKSDGKQDAAQKIMKRFDLDEEQTDAILELKLYKLARLEILLIQKEIGEKRTEQKRLQALLKSPAKRWEVIRSELKELREQYADKRRTRIVAGDKEPEFTAEDFIIDEDAMVILTAHGWVKRQQTVRDLASTRVREGDRVMACIGGSTRSTVAFFSSKGSAYVTRIADVPPSTGYGDPIQKLFKFDDQERVVGAMSFDPRFVDVPDPKLLEKEGLPPGPYGVAVTKLGLAFRFPLFPHFEPSTRAGRRFGRLKEGDEILTVFAAKGMDYVIAASDDGHAIAVSIDELATLSGPGQGTMLIKLEDDARLIGAIGAPSPRTGSLAVITEKGKRFELFVESNLAGRGSRGKQIVKTSRLVEVETPLPEVPSLGDEEKAGR